MALITNQNRFSEALERARNELLDLGLRNPLLNFRTMRARGIQIEGGDSLSVTDKLIGLGKPLYFSPKAESSLQALADNALQTPYEPEILQKRLIYSSDLAESYIQEKGVNILFLAVGMLYWRPADRERHMRAPLFLVPVALKRETINDHFCIEHAGLGLAENLTLRTKLRQEFGIELPTFDLKQLTGQMFEQIQAELPADLNWRIEPDDLELGFFAYNRFVLYDDLDPARWTPLLNDGHPVMNALYGEYGFRERQSAVKDGERVDKYISLEKNHLILEADSTQLVSLIDAQQGMNLVIQGPPGTGKSQTITNLIGEALGQGKKVLFVAEKMAALEVVKRKLAGLGLEDLALELHSHKTTKRDFAAALNRSLVLGSPTHDGALPEVDELKRVQATLNDHSFLMNRPIVDDGPTPFEAYGQLISLENKLAGADWSGLQPEFEQMRHALRLRSPKEMIDGLMGAQVLENWRKKYGYPADHPFAGTTTFKMDPVFIDQFREPLSEWHKATQLFLSDLEEVRQTFNVPQPENLIAAENLLSFGEKLQDAPYLIDFETADSAWFERADEITELLTAGQKLMQLKVQYAPMLIPEAWSADLLDVRGKLMVSGSGVFRHLSGDYREARRTLAGLCREQAPSGRDEQLALVDVILEAQRLEPLVKGGLPLLQSIIGAERLSDIESADWADLVAASLWLIVLHQDIDAGKLPDYMLLWLQEGVTYDQRTGIYPLLQRCRQSHESMTQAARQATSLFGMRLSELHNLPLSGCVQRLAAMAAAPERIEEIVFYNRVSNNLRNQRFEVVLPFAEKWKGGDRHLANLVEYAWISSLTEQVVKTNGHLENFDGATHDEAVEAFRQLDKKWLAYNRVRLAHAHREGYSHMNAGGISDVLIKESQKRSNNRPIRELISLAAERIQQMRPLFMMSPLSIATFLPPGEIEFDLVIFDEASQVRPVDALGAILRGKQTVVVGDNKQLPPTSFFDTTRKSSKTGAADETNADDWVYPEFWDEDEDVEYDEAESILDLFLARGAPQRMLRWHYRSQHESLIALSNREFYDKNLVLFPSPDGERAYSGLQLRHNPNTVYDRGNSRTNVLEAADIAQAVIDHAHSHPELSLGVATFSSAQQQAVRLELERVRAEHPECEPFFKAHEHEPFFVKNLENVQGDERDVIFISVGYGRDQDGKVRLNFGPLNGRGGERRLNVLITRSRLRCVVFTNLTSADIDLRRTDSVGIRAFKAYLAYAESGELPAEIELQDDKERPFFDSVRHVLESNGYEVESRIGRGGVEVDLGVKTADGRRIAIELDGRDYHRALSARDRDRIQHEVLTRLGWEVHRLWIHDWFRDRAGAEQKLLGWIGLDRSTTEEDQGQAKLESHDLVRLADRKIENFVFPPYYPADWSKIRRTVKKQNERGEHVFKAMYDVLQQRKVVDYWDFLTEVWDYSGYHTWDIKADFYKKYNVLQKGERPHLYLNSMYMANDASTGPVLHMEPRSRGKKYRSHSTVSMKIDDAFKRISPEEWQIGILQVVTHAIAINVFELSYQVAKAFGFGRLGKNKIEQIFEVILYLLAHNRLVLHDDLVSIPLDHKRLSNGLLQRLKTEWNHHEMRKRFEQWRKKPAAATNQKQIDLPIEANPYRLADTIELRPIRGWTSGGHKKESVDNSIADYRFDRLVGQFVIGGEADIDYWSYYDFEEELKEIQIVSLFSHIGYDFQDGRFYHDGTFALAAKRPGKWGLWDDEVNYYRVWRNPADGLFYGRVRSHTTRNYHLFDKWAQGRRFGSARLDLCLGDLKGGTFTPEKCKKLNAKSGFTEVAVSDPLIHSVRQQEFEKLEIILQTEQPIHMEALQRRMADFFGYKTVTSSVKNFTNQVVGWGVQTEQLLQDGEFLSLNVSAVSFEPRNRTHLASVLRRMEYVHDRELEWAIGMLRAEDVTLTEKNASAILSQFFGVRKAMGEQRKRIIKLIG